MQNLRRNKRLALSFCQVLILVFFLSPAWGQFPASLPAGSIIINEIYNSPETGGIDWIELHNTSTRDVVVRGWEIEVVTDVEQQTTVALLPDDRAVRIPGGGYLLVTNVDPEARRNVLAGGVGVTRSFHSGLNSIIPR